MTASKINKISFIGLGKLGLGLALSIADSGIEVQALDADKKITSKLKKGVLPIYEPGLKKILKRNINKKLKIHNNKKTILENTDVTYILIQTPSKKNGRFNSVYLEKLIFEICGVLSKISKKHHTIVICSTLQPETLNNKIIPIINSFYNLKVGENIGLVYNPESVALGEIVKGFQHPDYVIIGKSDNYSGDLIQRITKKYTKSKPEIVQMSLTSGEICKITLNAFLCMKISFANFISQISLNIEDADHNDILKTIGNDKRIGSKFLSAGPSFGGTCFPRDVIAFSKFNKDMKISSSLIDSVKKINDNQHTIISNEIRKIIKIHKVKKICIFGLSFKDATPVTFLSPSIKLLSKLTKLKLEISAYDKYVVRSNDNAFKNIKIYKNIKNALSNNELIILMHNNNDALSAELNKIKKSKIIYSVWSNFKLKADRHILINLGQK